MAFDKESVWLGALVDAFASSRKFGTTSFLFFRQHLRTAIFCLFFQAIQFSDSHEIQRTYSFFYMRCHVFHYLRVNARNVLLISIFIFLFIFWLKLNDPATFLISFGYEKTAQTTAQMCPLISPKLSKTRILISVLLELLLLVVIVFWLVIRINQ